MKNKKHNKKKTQINPSNILVCIFYTIIFILFGMITYQSLFNNHRSIIQIKPSIIIISCVIYIFMFIILYKIINRFIKDFKKYTIILFCILIMIQIVFITIFQVQSNTPWDFGSVVSLATKYVNGISKINENKYLYIYSNNVGITLFLSFFFYIGKLFHYTNYMNIGYLLNIIAIDISLIYACKSTNILFPDKYKKIFILIIMTFSPFITFTPIFYTDTIAMPFVTVSFYYFIKYFDNKNIKNLIVAGIMIGIGTNIKFIVIIILIAYFIVWILYEKKDKKSISHLFILLIVSLLPILLLNLFINTYFDSNKRDSMSFPAVHWINMGLHGYGGYTPEDVEKTKSQHTKKEKIEINKKSIKKTLYNYYKNGELISFYLNKEVYIWGDGQYYIIQKLERTPVHNYKIKKYIMNYPDNKFFELFCQTQQILLLVFITLGALLNKYINDSAKKTKLLSSISVFGITLFLTMWEARSRYLVCYLPVIIICGLFGLLASISFIKSIKKEQILKMFYKIKNTNIKPLLKLIPIIYLTMFILIIILLLFVSGIPYHLKRKFLISNIYVIIPFIISLYLFYKYDSDKKVKPKLFKKYVLIIFIIILLIQTIMITHIYFYTDWDVKVIRNIVNNYIKTGSIKDNFYLSVYPNNLLLTSILAFIKKLPLIGKYYVTTLIINALLVNISGVLTALTIRNLKSEKAALISYIFTIPLILLTPWIVIPYSDTFAIPCVIAVMYLYSKKKKKMSDYFLIGFIAILGYKIKPTVIIILMAITMVEIIYNYNRINKRTIKQYSKTCGTIFIGIITAFLLFKCSKLYLRFQPVSYAKPITYVHYLAMGQNEKTLGSYSQKDVDDTHNFGREYDIHKFKKRVLNRTISETIVFYTKKTLLNFNDGSFCWGLDGSFFYKKVKAPNCFAKFLRKIYYSNGKYFKLFIQIQNYIWLIVLMYCPWIIKKKNTKEELVIMLSIIGLVLFLTIFEPRTRYMYCYSEIYVIAAVLGMYNLKEYIIDFKKKKQKEIK